MTRGVRVFFGPALVREYDARGVYPWAPEESGWSTLTEEQARELLEDARHQRDVVWSPEPDDVPEERVMKRLTQAVYARLARSLERELALPSSVPSKGPAPPRWRYAQAPSPGGAAELPRQLRPFVVNSINRALAGLPTSGGLVVVVENFVDALRRAGRGTDATNVRAALLAWQRAPTPEALRALRGEVERLAL